MKKGKKKRLSRNERLSTYIGIIHRVSAITVSVPSRTTVPPPILISPHTSHTHPSHSSQAHQRNITAVHQSSPNVRIEGYVNRDVTSDKDRRDRTERHHRRRRPLVRGDCRKERQRRVQCSPPVLPRSRQAPYRRFFRNNAFLAPLPPFLSPD